MKTVPHSSRAIDKAPMRIVIFTHPAFSSSQSMPRFVRLLVEGLRPRGHRVETLSASARLVRLAGDSGGLRKWLGYIDQFILFPLEFLLKRRTFPASTLFVFSDQALGPWVPMVARRHHIIHCHDFLALRSALGEWPQNRTGWTGRRYQALIRWGFRHGKNFVSDSHATHRDLERFLVAKPRLSTAIHIGLNYPFSPMPLEPRLELLSRLDVVPPEGFLLHVGGNQWYKNRPGVIALYEQYALSTDSPLPLWMIGSPPSADLLTAAKALQRGSVHFITNASDEAIHAAYSHARLLLFPSYAEGFGWPIVEAMACSCLVITSDSAPMTEVGGSAAIYIPTPPAGPLLDWAKSACQAVTDTLDLSHEQADLRRQNGNTQAALFRTSTVLDTYETLYGQVLAESEA